MSLGEEGEVEVGVGVGVGVEVGVGVGVGVEVGKVEEDNSMMLVDVLYI